MIKNEMVYLESSNKLRIIKAALYFCILLTFKGDETTVKIKQKILYKCITTKLVSKHSFMCLFISCSYI